jgi:hypothetical protein
LHQFSQIGFLKQKSNPHRAVLERPNFEFRFFICKNEPSLYRIAYFFTLKQEIDGPLYEVQIFELNVKKTGQSHIGALPCKRWVNSLNLAKFGPKGLHTKNGRTDYPPHRST